MKDTLNEILPSLEEIRKELHQNPELSEQEYKTAKRILEYLKSHCRGDFSIIAETGVLAVFDSGREGKSILLRADTDALPISEINQFEYKSIVAGVSHKCGHDGHTSMMLGVARLLSIHPIEQGKVILLFQPAEENGMGAAAVLNDRNFQNYDFDYVFALHNIPGFKKNLILLKENAFNANVKSMIIRLNGKTAHAAEPEKGHNPALAIADILHYAEKETKNKPNEDDFFLITPIYIKMGEQAHGISAGDGELHLTIRSWDLKLFDTQCSKLEKFIKDSCEAYKLEVHISWTQVFYANYNNASAIEFVRKAAIQNDFEVYDMESPFKWGEDFGLFTQKHKGAMFGIGAGETTPALHNPDYDFPDDIAPTGIMQFYQIIQEVNKAP